MVLIIVQCFPAHAASEQAATTPEDSGEGVHDHREVKESASYWTQGAYWLEHSRDDWSEKVDWLARGIDRFFAGKETIDSTNKSYVRVRADGRWLEGEGYSDDSDLKFRLHLPATQKRFNIIIESATEDKETLEEKSRPGLTQEAPIDEGSLTAAIEFARNQAKLWKTRSLLGVKAQIPGDVFIKLSAKRRWELDDYWTMPYKIEVAEYLSDGLEVEHSLAFERPLQNELFFSAKSRMEWTEEEQIMRGAQVFSIRQRLSKRRGIDYRLGFIGRDVAKPRLTSTFVSAHYRELLYKNWLYWNIIPEVNFPRHNGFEPVVSLNLRLEIFFQK